MLARTAFAALCVLTLLGVSVGLAGCALPGTSTGSTKPDLNAVADEAISHLQSILGLSDGAITRSSDRPVLRDSDVSLAWTGGRAEVDAETGRITMVLIETARSTTTSTSASTSVPASVPASTPGAAWSAGALDREAARIVELLGWDAALLADEGFTPGTAKTIDRGDGDSVYQKTWIGHDEAGIPNQGLIEVGIDKTAGELRTFFYSPGPRTAAATPQKITKDQAVSIAKEAAGTNPPGPVTTTDAPVGGTTTTGPRAITVESATLVHTDAPGITGGGDALVWIVKLGGNSAAGKIAMTVYVDAVTGETLSVLTAG
jgi:Peptidase propeptide and YPEB domain